MASQTQGIQQLLAAEKRAAEKVAEARRRKARRLKDAKDESTEEIEKYREEREAQFKKFEETHQAERDEIAARIDNETHIKVEEMVHMVAAHRDNIIEEVLKHVTDITPEMHKNYRQQDFHHSQGH